MSSIKKLYLGITLLSFLAAKAVAQDTVEILRQKAHERELVGDYKGQFYYLFEMNQLNKDLSARNFYFLIDAGIKAGEYDKAEYISLEYIQNFPNEPQPYFLRTKAAILKDYDTTRGSAIPAIEQYNQYLKRDISKNLNRIISNLGYELYFYSNKSKDYEQAIISSNKILEVDPSNKFALSAKQQLQSIVIRSKQQSTEGLRSRSNESNNIILLPYTELNGVKIVKGKILGNSLDFIFDTGASLVNISLTELLYFIKNNSDGITIVQKSKSKIADGSVVDSYLVIIKEIEIAGLKLHDVLASSSYNLDAPLLLGNSVIDRLGEISIVPAQHIIKIKKQIVN